MLYIWRYLWWKKNSFQIVQVSWIRWKRLVRPNRVGSGDRNFPPQWRHFSDAGELPPWSTQNVGALYLPFDVLDQGSMFTLSPSQALLSPFGKNETAESNLLNHLSSCQRDSINCWWWTSGLWISWEAESWSSHSSSYTPWQRTIPEGLLSRNGIILHQSSRRWRDEAPKTIAGIIIP